MSANYCKCGCKTRIKAWSKRWNKPLEYAHGHNWKGKTRPTRLVAIKIKCACGCGEIIDNIRRKKDGKPYRVKYQKGHGRKGKLSHFWKGGVTEESKIIRQSTEYRRWRKAVFERDKYICVFCGAKSGSGKAVELQADHIKPFAHNEELRFEVSNGRTLCRPCHLKTDTFGGNSRIVD